MLFRFVEQTFHLISLRASGRVFFCGHGNPPPTGHYIFFTEPQRLKKIPYLTLRIACVCRNHNIRAVTHNFVQLQTISCGYTQLLQLHTSFRTLVDSTTSAKCGNFFNSPSHFRPFRSFEDAVPPCLHPPDFPGKTHNFPCTEKH